MGNIWSGSYTLPLKPMAPADLDSEVDKDNYADLTKYDWPFENLILEGGGSKGTAYPGALQVLEDVGILGRIKRFGGSSAGACVAGLLSVGYRPGDITSLLNLDQKAITDDAWGGYVSLLPNFLRFFGWNPGEQYLNVLRMYVEHKTGNPDYTFKQLYDDRKVELCVVCANVSKKGIEYFHPKTTPDVPIALAMRMSASIPGYFQPKSIEKSGHKHFYVDGGMLCNYPIHAFDGWFLSMRPEDTFFKKLGTEQDPFHKSTAEPSGDENKRHKHETIGIVLYSTDEMDLMKLGTNSRELVENAERQRPDTPLARLRGEMMNKVKAEVDKKSEVISAAKSLFRTFADNDLNRDGGISLTEFKRAITQLQSREPKAIEVLFGDKFDLTSSFKELDYNEDKLVTATEFMAFLENKGVISPLEAILDVSNTPIHSLRDYVGALLATYDMSSQRQYVKASDASRTIGVCTDYITTLDMDMETQDKIFLRNQGRWGTVVFLREYASRHNIFLKP